MGLDDGAVAVWDVAGEVSRLRLLAHTSPVVHVLWSPDGEVLATSDQQTVRFWSTEGKLLRTIETSSRWTPGLAWSSEGRRLTLMRIVGTRPAERTVLETWDPSSGELLASREDPGWDRCYLGVSADRRHLAIAMPNGMVQVWDLAQCRSTGTVPAGFRRIHAVALCEQKRLLVLGYLNGAVEVWDLRKSERMHALTESERSVYSAAFSPGGEILAVKSRDGTVRLWWCGPWTRVATIDERSPAQVEAEIAFHPRQPRLATYDRLNTAVRIWDLDLDELRIGSLPMIRILFLSADPFAGGEPPLHLDREIREIRERLSLARLWDHFEVYPELAVRPADLTGTLLDYRPHIVHFSGHGDGSAIFVEGDSGEPHPIAGRALANLFSLVAQDTFCVVLNACYSQDQARVIARNVKYVIGMRKDVDDRSAIAFSIGFYQALGSGRSIDDAFSLGCAQIDLRSLPDSRMPALWKDGKKVRRELEPPPGARSSSRSTAAPGPRPG
jgi:CHAT domain/WD domain, G-beta repeat